MDDFDIDNLDFDAAEAAAKQRALQKDEHDQAAIEAMDEGDGCEGGACKIWFKPRLRNSLTITVKWWSIVFPLITKSYAVPLT